MDHVGRLIHIAGAREPVPERRLERSRRVVQAHWEEVVAARRSARRTRRQALLTSAAVIVLMLGAMSVFRMLSGVPAIEPAAVVARVLGDVRVAGEAISKGDAVDADAPIETGNGGRVALNMPGGQSLRIDSNSRAFVHSPSRIALHAGGVYIDTAPAADERPIEVATTFGVARDIGTQFQVRLLSDALLVGVREGLVEITQPGGSGLSVNKGRFVELSASGEQTDRPLESGGPDWDWIESVAPEFDIEGATLKQYLEWYALEKGLELVWADDVSEQKARDTRLTGSIAGTGLDEGLDVVQRITALGYQISGNTIQVRVD